MHILLQCPALAVLRARWVDRLPLLHAHTHDTGSMRQLMLASDQRTLAAYVHAVRDAYVGAHNVCVDALACEICRNREPVGSMLICSGMCVRGFHVGCLGSELPFVPKYYQAWFCADCCAARRGNYCDYA